MSEHVVDAEEVVLNGMRLSTRIELSAENAPDHRLDGWCWCQPLVEDDLAGGHVYIHRRSLDSPHIEMTA